MQHQGSAGTDIQQVAEAKLRRKLSEIEKGVPVDQSRKLRYEDIKEGLLTDYRNNHIGLIASAEAAGYTGSTIWTSSSRTCG